MGFKMSEIAGSVCRQAVFYFPLVQLIIYSAALCIKGDEKCISHLPLCILFSDC